MLFPFFKRRVFPVNGGGQVLRPFEGGFVRQPGGGGGLGAEIAVQFRLARGKIPDGAFQRVQQRQHFTDSGISVRHVFHQNLNENPLPRERVCAHKPADDFQRKGAKARRKGIASIGYGTL